MNFQLIKQVDKQGSMRRILMKFLEIKIGWLAVKNRDGNWTWGKRQNKGNKKWKRRTKERRVKNKKKNVWKKTSCKRRRLKGGYGGIR